MLAHDPASQCRASFPATLALPFAPGRNALGSAAPPEPAVITIVFDLIREILRIYAWIVILAAIFQTLSAFGVLDTRNRFVWMIGDFLYRATEPVLRPIRRVLPNLGGIDFSPWIICVVIWWVLLPLVFKLEVAIVYGNTGALLF